MRKLKLLLAVCTLLFGGVNSAWSETDYTNLMPSSWTNGGNTFQTGQERYQDSNFEAGKIMYQSFVAPATGIYEIKFYAVASSTSGRGFDNIFGDNIAKAYASAGNNKTTLAMTVINQTGCTLVADANIRTLSVEATEGETIEYGLENIATGGNWYTIKAISAKMKTIAEIFKAQYDEAFNIWQYSTENETGARATFKTAVDALNTAMSGTLAAAQTASDNLAVALENYESKSYPIKGHNVKYDFTNKMNMAINAWTCKQGNGPAQYLFTGATETYGNTVEGEVMYQEITGLANGEYEIHFYAVSNAANGGGTDGSNLTYVYANDSILDIDVIKQNTCTPSDYERTFTLMVSDGKIKYGITNKGAAGNWNLCKNVALYMTGAPDLSDYYNAIAGKLTTANGLKGEYMNKDVLSALNTAINTANGYESITVIGELESISDGLTTAIDNANTSIGNYTAAKAILDKASTLDDAGKNSYSSNENVAALQASYNDKSLVAVTAEQETACAEAFVAAVKAQTTPNSDWTGAIVNPSFETGDFTGWTNKGMAIQGNDSFEKDGAKYAEKWQPNGTFNVTQTITAMLAGTYHLTAKVKARGVRSAKLFAGDARKDIVISDNTDTYTLVFACGANDNVNIGFTGEGTGAGSSWLCVDDFHLTYIGTDLPDVTAVEGKMNAELATAQTNAISTYQSQKNIENYKAATAAIAAAQDCIEAYSKVPDVLTKANGVLSTTNLYTDEGYNTYKSMIDNAQEKYNDNSLTTKEANSLNGTIFGTGYHSTAAVDDLLISAWDVSPRDWNSYHVNTWSTKGDSHNPNFVTPCIEYWTGDESSLADKVLTATLPDFIPGAMYKVTATICLAVNTGVDATTTPTGVSLQLNDGDAVVCSGTRIEETRFYEGEFTASGMIDVDGKLNVKINVAETNASWLTFRNVKYEKTSDPAAPTSGDLADLDAAIDAKDGKTLGFESGEYAPYNNVEVITALNAAKNVNRESQISVTTATNNLKAATWTANTKEVNAIYWTTYGEDAAKDAENRIFAKGWGLEGRNDAYNVRIQNDVTNNAGLAAVENNTAVFGKYDMTYGETTGYTMPLKANKIYKLSFKYGGWDNPSNTTVKMIAPDESELVIDAAMVVPGDSQNGRTDASKWWDWTGYFVAPANGNYVLKFKNNEPGEQRQKAIGNISLLSATEIVFADDALPKYAPGTYPSVKINRQFTTSKWSTAVYPFAVSASNIAVLDSYDNGKLAFKSVVSPSTSEANVPFMIKNDGPITLSNVAVVAAASTEATVDGASLKGVYTATEIDNSAFNYVLKDNTIYKVGTAGATINPYRAYIQIQGTPAARLTFTVDGEATAIEGIAAEKALKGDIYNLNGQRVKTAKKGVYIVNGKAVIVK